MVPSSRLVRRLFGVCLLACLVLAQGHHADSVDPMFEGTVLGTSVADTARANELIRRQPGFFVPNLGQWEYEARFVHRSGPLTLFLEDRGWVIDLVERPVHPETNPRGVHPPIPDDGEVDQKIRGVALKMTFEGDARVPHIVGEQMLPGHHDYFLGNDESRWRTEVPLFGSVRYEGLYPGIDLRLREANGVPEYDLLLQPGADLSRVSVHVEGGQGMSIARDGSLAIETVLGRVTQSLPKTWEVGADGEKREVACTFTLLGADRFGFAAPGWDGDTSLTIDPGLIWSTFLGGNRWDMPTALAVDARGVVTVAGSTILDTNYPTTMGAYDTTYNGEWDAFVSRLDPSKTGSAQLIYSTFLGGSFGEYASALVVDASGVVTVAGNTTSGGSFPTTSGAYDTTPNGLSDVFVSRLDPAKIGSAQLVYSTFLGGSSYDYASAVAMDAFGVVTLAGSTRSTNYPTTIGAYDTTYNGNYDAFVSRLDPSKIGSAQLVGSTFLGGSDYDWPLALAVDAIGVATVAGMTASANFPTTGGAYDRTYNGVGSPYGDAFVSRLDPFRIGTARLVYSSFLGGSSYDAVNALAVDARGVVTAVGGTLSANFPTTGGAYDTTYNGGDAIISRLDPAKNGRAQLVYSTFLGGGTAAVVAVDANGVLTVGGRTPSANFPTTSGAYDTTYNGRDVRFGDAFISRLDLAKNGRAQLVYSTFLGGTAGEFATAMSVDASGVVTVAGWVGSANFPTTGGAYDTTYNGGRYDVFVSRLDMGVALYGDVHAIPIKAGGTQRLTVNAGKAHAKRLYWIYGSITGTAPGINLLGVRIPLNLDAYTDFTIGNAGSPVLKGFRGTLDGNGLATASFNLPANLPLPSRLTFHHAYVVYDMSGRLHMASNAVPLRLR